MTFKTAQIAKLIGVHPNTIRLYEDLKLLPPIPRTESGYRIFNDRHVEQLRLLRIAFRAEIISDRLRQEAYEIIKTAATGDIDGAYRDTLGYLNHLRAEKARAEEAIAITIQILEDSAVTDEAVEFIGRAGIAGTLGITIDVLRDWERNGLINVPRNPNGYRCYGIEELNRLKIIRVLRNAHYSMMSILRMLNRLDRGETNIREAIDTPDENDDIVHATDRYITALGMAEADAQEMLKSLHYTTRQRCD
jgi:DNA-binding transcriptional MerR regulator